MGRRRAGPPIEEQEHALHRLEAQRKSGDDDRGRAGGVGGDMKPAILALADGTVFEGTSFGAEGECVGEVVFNTAMTGYQEVLTDPSYKGQIVCMTYPLIGNYGINPEDIESRRPFVEGFIVKEGSPYPSNWRKAQTLDAYLKEWRIVGIQGIDTRALTKHIRDQGAMEGVISTIDLSPRNLVEKARSSPGLIGRDLVKEVSCTEPFRWWEGEWRWPHGYLDEPGAMSPESKREQLDLFSPQSSPAVPRGGHRLRDQVQHPSTAGERRLRCLHRPGLRHGLRDPGL